jgi:hypothetical protein
VSDQSGEWYSQTELDAATSDKYAAGYAEAIRDVVAWLRARSDRLDASGFATLAAQDRLAAHNIEAGSAKGAATAAVA